MSLMELLMLELCSTGYLGGTAGSTIIYEGSEKDSTLMQSIGVSTVSTGLSSIMESQDLSNSPIDLQMTQAYIESLDKEELKDFIDKLDKKSIELSKKEIENQKVLKIKNTK